MYRKKPEDKLSVWNITIKIDGKKIELNFLVQLECLQKLDTI